MKTEFKVLSGEVLLRWERFCERCIEEAKSRMVQENGSQGRIAAQVDIRHPQNITIGTGSYINGGMLAASPNATINIGENCMISYEVHIRTDTHNHDDATKPMIAQGNSQSSITIEDDVWIGYGAQIMPGTTIGRSSIIGAGAVVTHDIPPYSVAVGVPARIIRSRLD